jgi:RNA polymerase sigma-70 factor (ECF subfamily)
MDDANLISAHRSGDAQAIAALMDRHGGVLMGFLSNRAGSEAEDLYQETWMRVTKGLESYNEQGSFKSWLFQIARRLLIDHHRRRGARVQLVLTEAHPVPVASNQPDQSLAAQQVGAVFSQTLEAMDPQMAQVVRMRLLEGVPFKEIAARQGVPLNTALGRMHRAMNRIRLALIAGGLLHQGHTP